MTRAEDTRADAGAPPDPAPPRILLYGYWRSSASWRVRIGLGLKGLRWETAPVHLVRDGGEQKKPGFTSMNPMAQVPVLEIGDGGRALRLTQSVAILEYLDERWPDPPLLPRGDDPAAREARARCRALVEIVNSGMQPLQNLGVLQRVKALGGDEAAWARDFLTKGAHALEAAAGDGPFLHGDRPGLADVCLIPQLYGCRRFGVDLVACPKLLAVEARCAELPAFQNARPEVQPDAQP